MSGSAAVLFVCFVLTAALVAGAAAVRSVSRIWLRHWAERRLHGSVAAVSYLERPQRLLLPASACVGMLAVLAGEIIALRGTGWSIGRGLLGFAIAIVFLARAAPRALARRWPTQIFPVVEPLLRAAQVAGAPVVLVGQLVSRHLAAHPAGPPAGDREIIQEVLLEGELEGVGAREEIAIISGVVEFGEKVVRDVMTMRDHIFAVSPTADPGEIERRIAEAAYTRVPVYRDSLDHIVGMLHVFDLLKADPGRLPSFRPVAIARPETPLNEQLFRMLRDRQHLAIVNDETGRTVGLVTLEDLLEELVGDIRDEHDEPSPPPATTPTCFGT